MPAAAPRCYICLGEHCARTEHRALAAENRESLPVISAPKRVPRNLLVASLMRFAGGLAQYGAQEPYRCRHRHSTTKKKKTDFFLSRPLIHPSAFFLFFQNDGGGVGPTPKPFPIPAPQQPAPLALRQFFPSCLGRVSFGDVDVAPGVSTLLTIWGGGRRRM